MKRMRVIKKVGASYFIHLLPSDLKDFSLQLGDEVDISDISKLEDKKK